MNKPYDTAAILRQNVEDLERELQRQRERADVAISELEATRDDNHKMMGEILSLREQNAAATARLRDQIERVTAEWKLAESAMASAREDLQLFVDSRDTWMARAMAAEAELKAAREQEPIKYLYRVTDCFGHDVLRDDPKGATILETIPLYAAPIPAPAPAVPYGVDQEAANRISLAVYDWEKGINPEPLLYAINRILATEAHPLSEEGQRAMLQSGGGK